MKQDLIDTDVTKNFYKDIKNPYAGLDDPFASLQNVAEDLTVDQKKFEQQESSGDIAADIGAQEQTNRQLTTKAAHELQLKKAGSKRETDMMVRKGAHETQMQMIKGEEDALSRDLNKQQALLGLVSGELSRSDAKAEAEKGFLGVNWSF